MREEVKRALRERKLTIGSWVTFPEPNVAEIMAQAGFDWLTIDMEHSSIELETAQRLIQVIELAGSVPLVRLPAIEPWLIKRLMDAGAHGMIAPMVNTAEDARRLVGSMRYPPEGFRGVGLARAQGYGFSFPEYREKNNTLAIAIAQIEHKDGVENLESILDVDGIDAVFIGPYDLSASLGISGQFDHPDIQRAYSRILSICRERKVTAGIHVVQPSPDEVRQRVEEGFTLVAYCVDMIMLGASCRDALSQFQSLQGHSDG